LPVGAGGNAAASVGSVDSENVHVMDFLKEQLTLRKEKVCTKTACAGKCLQFTRDRKKKSGPRKNRLGRAI
jgi:hypothetical protein